LPASRIVFSLCSSAGVQGVFVRLFFAGGPIGEEVILGSSPPAGGPEVLDGPDIGSGVGPDPDARLLFRGPVGDEVSGLPDVSAVVVVVVEGREACEGDIAVEVSTSVWFPRLDIGDESGCDAQPSDIEGRKIRKAGEKIQVCCARFKGPPFSRVDWSMMIVRVRLGWKYLVLAILCTWNGVDVWSTGPASLFLHISLLGRKSCFTQLRYRRGTSSNISEQESIDKRISVYHPTEGVIARNLKGRGTVVVN